MLAAFLLYALYAAADMAWALSVIAEARESHAGNGWALLGISAVANNAVIERLDRFAVICGALGLAALATRGRRTLVRVEGGGKREASE